MTAQNEITKSEDDSEIATPSFNFTEEVEPSSKGDDTSGIIEELASPELKPRVNLSGEPEELLDAWYASGSGATTGTKLLQRPLKVIIGEDNRVRITTTKAMPFRWICSLLITAKNNKKFVGTGFYIGKATIATAGHCVYMADQGGWAKSIEVSPGCNGTDKPFGSCMAAKLRSNAGWTTNNQRIHDYGAIIVPSDFTFGTQQGFFGFASLPKEQLQGKALSVVGYPSDGGPDRVRNTLWSHTRNATGITDTVISYDIDTVGGQSGSPLYVVQNGQAIVVGIHTNGSATANSATRLRPDVFENFKKWKAEGGG
jgi:V8-like Glu-specific endopeptidase